MNKNLKKKKGFTLIELIVVIAILGILAAIAVPRFTGFTDKAKVGADKQYAALVANAIVTSLAEGNMTITGDADFSIATTGAVSVTAADAANVGSFDPAADVYPLVAQKALKGSTTLTVNVTATGVVTLP